jgi:membrane-associated protein
MDLTQIIITVGYVGVFGIIFAETGLLVGFFLPGDSLLFTAGFLASPASAAIVDHEVFSLPVLIIGCVVAAIVGDTVGYWFGHRVGRGLFQREDSRFFKKKYLLQAQSLYEKHGGKIIILARFMPFVRTFAPIVAGIGTMHYRRFLSFNAIGGLLWATGIPLLGYFLGSVIPDVDKYLLPVIILIVLVSVAPPAIHVLRDQMAERAARKQAGETKTDLMG